MSPQTENNLPTLWQINKQLQEIGNAIEMQLGEITPEQEQQLASLLESNSEKVSNYCLYLDSIDSRIDFVKKQIEQASGYIMNLLKVKERMLNVSMAVLEMRNWEPIEGQNGRKLFSRKASSVEVTVEPNMLPSEFVRTKVTFEVDKKAIKEALQAKREIEGCRIIEKRHPQWK